MMARNGIPERCGVLSGSGGTLARRPAGSPSGWAAPAGSEIGRQEPPVGQPADVDQAVGALDDLRPDQCRDHAAGQHQRDGARHGSRARPPRRRRSADAGKCRSRAPPAARARQWPQPGNRRARPPGQRSGCPGSTARTPSRTPACGRARANTMPAGIPEWAQPSPRPSGSPSAGCSAPCRPPARDRPMSASGRPARPSRRSSAPDRRTTARRCGSSTRPGVLVARSGTPAPPGRERGSVLARPGCGP